MMGGNATPTPIVSSATFHPFRRATGIPMSGASTNANRAPTRIAQ